MVLGIRRGEFWQHRKQFKLNCELEARTLWAFPGFFPIEYGQGDIEVTEMQKKTSESKTFLWSMHRYIADLTQGMNGPKNNIPEAAATGPIHVMPYTRVSPGMDGGSCGAEHFLFRIHTTRGDLRAPWSWLDRQNHFKNAESEPNSASGVRRRGKGGFMGAFAHT